MSDKSYNNLNSLSDKKLLERIGRFIQSNRLNQNRSQAEVSDAAGLSRSTLSLLERGENVQIGSLIQVLRVLDLLYVLDVFVVTEQISPIELAKLQKNKRKQASPTSRDRKANISDLGW